MERSAPPPVPGMLLCFTPVAHERVATLNIPTFARLFRVPAPPNTQPLAISLHKFPVKRNGFATLLTLLLSAVLLSPIIPTYHSGSLLGIRVFIVQAAAFSALAVLLTQASILGGSFKSIVSRGPGLPLLLLFAWAVISFLVTAPHTAHARGIAQVELLRIGTGIVIYFAALYGCRSRFQLRTISKILMGGAILAATAALITCSPSLLKPARGAFGEEQLMGAFLATLLPVAAAFSLKELLDKKAKPTTRLLKSVGAIFVLCALLLTGERMSWISGTLGTVLAVGLAFWAGLVKIPNLENRTARTRFWAAPLMVLTAAVGANILFMSCVPAIHHRLNTVQAKVSIDDRLQTWAACDAMIRARPLTGWGIGSFPLQAANYISHVPTAAQVERGGVTLSSIAHNEYLQMGAELGLIGLGLYLAALVGFFVYGTQSLKKSTSITRRWLLLAALVGVSSQSLNAVSNPGWHFSDISPLFWLLMGMGMAAATPRVINETRKLPLTAASTTLRYPTKQLVRTLGSVGLGVGLILVSVSVSLGRNASVAYYFYGYPPIISNALVSPDPLPVAGGILTAKATVTNGGSGVGNVYAYLYEDASYLTSKTLSFAANSYSGIFNIPANTSPTTAHVWTVQFYAYNNLFGFSTASALATQPAAAPTTLYVPSQYSTIQAAVDASVSGGTVIVADGTYSGPGNRDIDFHGKSLTVTSQNGPAKTIIDCGGFASAGGLGNHRGFYLHRGELNAKIVGFTVKNGFEKYIPYTPGNPFTSDSGYGGGIYISDDSGGTIIVTNCTISGNTSSDEGGGICNSTSPQSSGVIVLTDCNISGNKSRDGGGVYNFCESNSSITMANCIATGNSADFGGGVFNRNYGDGNTISLTNCKVTDNIGSYGGGVLNLNNGYNDSITLTNCTLTGNTAKNILESVTIGNIHSGEGGGVFNFNNNRTRGGSGTITLLNCSLSSNIAQMGNGGGGIFDSNGNNDGTFILTNNLLYGDTGGEIVNAVGAAPTVSFSDIQGGTSGTGNIDADPLFVSVATSDLHLKPGSPCFGKGTPIGVPATDKDGRTRPNPPSMGAYEQTGTVVVSPDLYPTIQAAATAAHDGDTVLVPSGTYSGPGNADQDFGGKNVIVKSMNGAANTIIDCGGFPSTDGSGNHRAFYLHSGETAAVIDGFTIKNGYQVVVPGVADSGSGGGLCLDGSGATILHCILSGNTAAVSGGGLAVIGRGHHSVKIINGVFTGNKAHSGGGESNNNDTGSIGIIDCIFTGNNADKGGATHTINNGGSVGTISCIISGNTGNDDGGGSHNENDSGNGDISMINCSVSGNASPIGDIYDASFAGSTITLLNDIIYGDKGTEVVDAYGPTTASFCDIKGGYAGTGNIDADPLFANAATSDLHIQPPSPCRAKGTPDGAPATDFDNNVRPNPPSMGAYDLGSGEATRAVLLVHGTFSDASSWNSGMLQALKSHGLIVEAVDFPTEAETKSNEAKIEDQASALKRRIGELITRSGQASVDLVCHSMGGLAARYYLEHQELWQKDGQGISYSGVSKLIMLGTPNLGFDAPQLDPVSTVSQAHLAVLPLKGSDTTAVDQYDNWSPALKEMFAEWEPAPETDRPDHYYYPTDYKLGRWNLINGSFDSPIQTYSYIFANYVISVNGTNAIFSKDVAAINIVKDYFPRYNRRDRNYHSLSNYPIVARQLGVPYPSAAGIHGVDYRLASPFLIDLNSRPMPVGVAVYLVAGGSPYALKFQSSSFKLLTVKGPYSPELQNDGIVPMDSALGFDNITKQHLFSPAGSLQDYSVIHTDLPKDPFVVDQVLQWLQK